MKPPPTWSPTWTLGFSETIAQRCDELAWNGPYRQYARSPHRVSQVLDHLNVRYPLHPILDRLQAWFLFMAVADDAIDHGSLASGADLLAHIQKPLDTPHPNAPISLIIAEVFKRQLDDACRPAVLERLEAVYQAVIDERKATTAAAFLPARRRVGWTCSTLNYALISPLLGPHPKELRKLLGDIGVVGVLIDSLVDYPRDYWRREIQFPLTPKVYARTAVGAAATGVRLTARHPRLAPIFAAAILDNLVDPLRR